METVKLSPFDRLLNIHQSVELNQTKKINKRILQEQIYQNAEMQRLNAQLDAANDISRQILENQMREISHKETLKFYKELSFKMHEFARLFDDISDPIVKAYFINHYYEQIRSYAKAADNHLEEINDKIFNKSIITRIDELKLRSGSYNDQLENSPLSKITKLIQDRKIVDRKIERLIVKNSQWPEIKFPFKPKRKNSPIRTIGLVIFGLITGLFLLFILVAVAAGKSGEQALPGLIILFLMGAVPFLLILRRELASRKEYPKYMQFQEQFLKNGHEKQNDAKKEAEDEIKRRKEELQAHPSYKVYEEIMAIHPDFEKALIKFSDFEKAYLPTDNPKWDSLFEDAAKVVVTRQQASVTLLQKAMDIREHRAKRLIGQLEEAGIIEEPFVTGMAEPLKVLIANEDALDDLLARIITPKEKGNFE